MPYYLAMLHLAVESAFEDLLANWRAHDSRRRRRDLSTVELAASRLALDKARHRMHKLRTAIYPEPSEREAIVESIWCESLDSVVHLRWSDRHPTRPGNFECPCGLLVPVDWNNLGAKSAPLSQRPSGPKDARS